MHKKNKSTNKSIADYLRYYIEMKMAPGYAILINGEWGTGKTRFIKRFIQANSPNKFLYVSLYGISSIDQIKNSVFRAQFPILAHPRTQAVFRAVCRWLKLSAQSDINNGTVDVQIEFNANELNGFGLLNKSKNHILVFDDLERCVLPIAETLGYINKYVEHRGQKVIVLTHDSKISQIDLFRDQNEKSFGRMFRVEPEMNEALAFFINELPEAKSKNVLTQNFDLIVNIYNRSNYKNLRTLKYSVGEYHRLFSFLPKFSEDNEQFQTACINTFFSLCIGIRSGAIQNSDLKSLTKSYHNVQLKKVMAKDDKDGEIQSPLEQMVSIHFNGFVDEIALSDEVISTFFEYGEVSKLAIEESLQSSKFFIDDKKPSWMRFWYYETLSDDEFEKTYKEVNKNFEEFKYTKQGEFRHVAGLLLHLSSLNIIDLPAEDCKEKVFSILDEMCKKSLIEYDENIGELESNQYNFYAGLGFSGSKMTAFDEITIKLVGYQKQKQKEEIKNASVDLFKSMQSSPKEFKEYLMQKNEAAKYSDKAILQYIDAQSFLDAYIACVPKDRFDISAIFKRRYRIMNHAPDLASELDWLKSLSENIEKKIPSLKQPTKWSVENLLADVKDCIGRITDYLQERGTQSE